MAEVAVETDSRFPIVGIGASAGGLQAIKLLFERMPADTGMAFVIVTHLPKGRESDLPEIIDRFTTMPAHAATADHPIEPNHVYVAPPDHIVTIEAGRLRLRAREDAVQRKPIDVFLSSLAKERADAAIGVLLSGSGNDGTLGMKAIKAFGGLTVAQGTDGDGPQHSEVPNAAIATGVVDSVLAVDEMAARLTEFARVFAQKESEPESEALEKAQPAICQILLRQTGHDFSGYKQRTFHRRVRRRMQVLGIAEPADYASRLSQDAEEVTLLFRDLLIGVTSFFRDADAFHALEELVIPQLFAGKGVSESVRVWVPGCATGEEAYSIAILLREHMDALKAAPKVQLFATDIDDAALGIARAGNYPEALVANLSETRLKRHFVNDGVTYSVSKEIREICVFSSHSVLRDPPFSRLELVSCRNLLIYLVTNFQARVIPIFHFALKPRGYLFLGTSENVGQSAELFAPVDKKQRIFQRRDHATPSFPVSALASGDTRAAAVSPELRRELVSGAAGLRRGVESQVIERYAPPHVLVNRDGEIVHYSVRTGKYLEPAVGLPNRQLIAMARKGLRLDLRAALREAVETGRTSQRERIAVEIDDRVQLVDLIVEPFGGVAAERLHDEVHQLHAIIDLDGNSFALACSPGLDGLAQRGPQVEAQAFASHGDQLPVGKADGRFQILPGAYRIVNDLAVAIHQDVGRRVSLYHLAFHAAPKAGGAADKLPPKFGRDGRSARVAARERRNRKGRGGMIATLKDTLLLVDGSKELGALSDILGSTEKEVSARLQRKMKNGNDPRLKIGAQINQKVAAGNELKAGKRRIAKNAVRREYADLPYFLRDGIGHAVIHEMALQSRLGQVCHQRFRVVSRPGDAERGIVDVRGEQLDLRRGLQRIHLLAQEDGDGVGFLAGRTTGHPDSDGLAHSLASEQLRDHQLFERVERVGIAEEAGDADEKIAKQKRDLFRVLAQSACIICGLRNAEDLHATANPAVKCPLLITAEVVTRLPEKNLADGRLCLLEGLGLGFALLLCKYACELCQARGHLVDRQHGIDDSGRDRRIRHFAVLGPVAVRALRHCQPAEGLDGLHAEGAVIAAAGEQHADCRVGPLLGERAEEDVDRLALDGIQ